MNVSDIAEILGISQPACTKHLKIMEAAGLFKRERVAIRCTTCSMKRWSSNIVRICIMRSTMQVLRARMNSSVIRVR